MNVCYILYIVVSLSLSPSILSFLCNQKQITYAPCGPETGKVGDNTNLDYEIRASIYRNSRKKTAGAQLPTDIC